MADEGRQKLIEVIDNIKRDPKGVEEFAHDPVGYLRRKGINADGLLLSTHPTPGNPLANTFAGGLGGAEVSDADLAMVAGGSAMGCFSLGYYGCYSEGN
jgi:hypothetical protein